MSTALTTTRNSYIQALDQAITSQDASIERLIIADNDPQLLNSLLPACAGQAVIVLEVPQDDWDFEDEQLNEALAWALQIESLSHLSLAGHSQLWKQSHRATVAASVHQGRTAQPTGFSRILQGAARTSTQNRNSQQTFAQHIRNLSQLPAVLDRRESGELSIQGLFYRADSGTFFIYDPKYDSYRPLAAS